MLPTPIPPIVMRLLGASAPNTRDGMIDGNPATMPATVEPFRRPRLDNFLLLMPTLQTKINQDAERNLFSVVVPFHHFSQQFDN
jgi:hypothetical protein